MFGLFTKEAPPKNNYQEGVVTEIVYQSRKWRVSFEATHWFAQTEHPVTLNPGDFVRVVGKANTTTLLVEPA